MTDGHAADLDDLRELVDLMTACAEAIDVLADDVAAHDHALHASWSGLASRAHRARQEEWQQRATTMHDALSTLRAHVGQAHDNYAWAVRANVRMWEQLR